MHSTLGVTWPKGVHSSSVERFSENFDKKAETCHISFLGMHRFQKHNLWKNSLSPFWGHWGRRGQTTSKPKMTKIHLVFTSFIVLVFQGRLTSATSVTSKGAQGIFSKVTFLKSVHSKEKDEVCLGFLVKIFTKSLHRGGVIEERWLLRLAILYQIMCECFIKVSWKWEKLSFIKDFTPLLLLRLCLLSVNHRSFFSTQ